MSEELLPAVAPLAPTKAEVVAQILKQQEASFDRADHAERLKRGIRKGILLNDPSIEYSLEELKSLVPLERDRMNYSVLAKNKHGLLSIGRPHGRLHPHMNKHQQAVKSASLRIFRELFQSRSELLQAAAAGQKIEYLGIPDAMLPKLGKLAAQLGIKAVKQRVRSRRDVRKRMQKASRKVNAGLLAGNQAHNFIMKGNQYGA